MDAIDPMRLYAFAEAVRLLPSCRAGARLNKSTLHRWRLEGRMAAVPRPAGLRTYWFVWGSELLRLQGGPAPAWNGRSPAQRQRGFEAAIKELREMGVVD